MPDSRDGCEDHHHAKNPCKCREHKTRIHDQRLAVAELYLGGYYYRDRPHGGNPQFNSDLKQPSAVGIFGRFVDRKFESVELLNRPPN